MITTYRPPPAPPRVGERRLEAPDRPEPTRPEPARPSDTDVDAFARVLRRKSGDDDEADGGEQGGDGGDTPPAPPTPDAPPPAPALRAAAAVSASPLLAAAELPAALVAAASRAALNGEAPASMATALRGDTPQAFEVSLQASPGVRVELRATREAVAPTGFVQAPAWNLSVGSPALNRAALARHASRLDDRLRAKGIDPGHVRIEDAPEEPR
jgi:hypothetical protein